MANRLTSSILAALLLSGCNALNGDPREQADQAIAANDLQAARVHLVAALQETPDDAALRLKLAQVLVDMGDAAAARGAIEQLPEGERATPQAQSILAHALLLTGKTEQALATASAISEASPRAAWVEVGALLASDRTEEAYKAADAALERFQDDARLLALRGEMALMRGRIAAARDYADQAIKSDTKSLYGLLLLGRLALLDEDRAKARDNFAAAAKAHPTVIGPLLYLVAVQADLGEREAALANLEQLDLLAPDHPMGVFLRAKIAFHDSDLDTAHSLLQSVEGKLRGMDQASLLLGEIAYLRGNQQTAIGHLRRFLENNPGHLQASLVLAQAYVAEGEEKAAWEVVKAPAKRAAASPQLIQLAARLAEKNGQPDAFTARLPKTAQASDAHIQLGKADRALSKGEWAEAAKIYAKLRANGFANNAMVLNNAAVAEMRSGKPAEAIKLARQAYALTPDDPQVQDTLASALLRVNGDKSEALRLTSKALAARPTDFTIRWNHAQALAANGQKAEAKRVASAILPFAPKDQVKQISALLDRL